MKHAKNALIFIFIASLCVPAFGAAVRCVRLSAPTVCTTSNDCYNTSDCDITCDNVTTTVVGRCGGTSGTADSSVVTNFNTSTTGSSNVWCWCAIVSPVTSRWVLRFQYASATQCALNCARGCRNGFIFDNEQDIRFRQTVYANILE